MTHRSDAGPLVESHTLHLQPLDSLPERVWDLNPRRYDLPAIAESLGKFGYGDPILIDDASGQIVAGQGVLAALLTMSASGEPAPARIVVEAGRWLIPCVHFRLRGGESRPYSVATNRTQELGGWQEDLLLDILQEIQATDPLGLVGTGFTDTDLGVLQQKAGGDLPATFKQLDAPRPDPVAAVTVAAESPPASAAAPAPASVPPPTTLPSPAATVTRTVHCPHCGEAFAL